MKRGFFIRQACARSAYIADEELGAIIASLDDGAIGAADELAIGAASDDDGAIGAADELGAIGAASDEDVTIGAADDDVTTTALDETTAIGVVVGVPRLKIQIRPMITITATMMIIQVLRFIRFTLGWWEEVDWGKCRKA
jgi:hypothetical protein